MLLKIKYLVNIRKFCCKIETRKLRNKNNIANFVNKTDFDNELKDITSDKNELNELPKKV